jgi:hypothetical protein
MRRRSSTTAVIIFLGPLASHNGAVELEAMAAPLVALHVAAYAECLAAPGMWALEWLLPSVRVAVDP